MNRERTVYSQLIRRGWLQRTIRLSGEVDALIEYDAVSFGIGGAEPRVLLDGAEVVVSRRGPLWTRHRLLLPALRHGQVPVLEIDFTKFGLVQLRSFRLSLNADVLYEEEHGTVVRLLEPPPLPIPSRTPPPDPNSLPIASAPEAER